MSPTDQPILPAGRVGQHERLLDRTVRRPAHRDRGRTQRLLAPAPALSADGRRIAYVATGELRPPQSSFINPGFDLFYVDLGSAAYRSGGLRASTIELTRAGNNTDSRATPPIDTVSITRDGRYVGITTSRVVFAGGTLAELGAFRASSDTEEGYVIDMTARTIDRVVTNANGGDADASISGPLSLSADASLVAFVSSADNLIFGDANGVADAFVAHRTPGQPETAAEDDDLDGDVHDHEPAAAARRSRVSAKRRTDTSMTLSVHVPGAGGIAAIARRRGHGSPVIARAFSAAKKRGTFRVTLSLLSKYAALVRKGQSVSATVTVTWSPKGKGAKKRSVDVKFKRSVKKAKPRKHR